MKQQSSLLEISTRWIAALLWVLSLVILYRGHNFPGGGFIGGLTAASAVLLVALTRSWQRALVSLRLPPIGWIVAGLTIALVSAMPGFLFGSDFMAGMWLPTLELPLLGKLKLGTPLLFDVGVYLTVIGFTVTCASTLGSESEVSEWNS